MIKKLFWILVLLSLLSFPTELSSQPETVSFAFVGDVMLARNVGRKILSFGTGYPLAKVKDILSSADLTFANLEGVLSGNKVSGSSRAFIFRSPPYFGQSLVDGGIDLVSLANNHINDGGSKGIIDTVRTLEDLGIGYVGAGRDKKQAESLRVLEVKGKLVGFLGYTDITNIPLTQAEAQSSRPGVASCRDTQKVIQAIRQATSKVDLLVVSFHWGTEYRIGEPTERQKRLAYQAVRAGADLIIGHHPHVLEKIEVYQGKTIAYSLGNFVFDNHRPSRARTMILWVEWDPYSGQQSIKTIPCYIRACRPELVKR